MNQTAQRQKSLRLIKSQAFSLSKNPGFQEEKTGDLAYMGLKIVRM